MEQNNFFNENVGIYMWTSPSGKMYIGQSIKLKERKRNFLKFNLEYAGDKINKARKKYNHKEDWTYEVLEYCTEDLLDEREVYWVKLYDSIRNGYNIQPGGFVDLRHKSRPEEVRKKISESLKGRFVGENSPNYGRHMSDETKRKLSEKLKGHIIPEEVRVKLSLSNIGKHNFTEEQRKRISENRKGIVFTEEHKKHLSESLKGRDVWNKGIPCSEETKRKLSIANSNPSEETRKKMSESLKGRDVWNKGIPCSEETKRKLSIANSNPSEETRKRLSESHKGKPNYRCRKPVLQYDLEGNFIRKWDFIADVQKELGIKSISTVCLGKVKSAGEYMWRYYEGGEIPSKIQPCKRNTKSLPVLQYTKEGVFVREWESATSASKELGISRQDISKVCLGKGKVKSAGGYIWRFYEGDEIPSKIQPCKRGTTSKPILQYSKEGEFIKEWDSVTSASKELGISHQNISSVCLGKLKSTGGYIWKYKDEPKK